MSKNKDDKRHVLQNYIIPNKDDHGQWWLGYQKVRLVKHPEWTKDFYNRNKETKDGD